LFCCCFGGEASVRAGIDRRLAAERLELRLVDRRVDGRADFGVAVRGLETVDFGLAVDALGLAAVDLAFTVELVEVRLVAVLGLAELVVDLVVVRLAAVRGLLVLVAEDRPDVDRLAVERVDEGRRADDRLAEERVADDRRAVEVRLAVERRFAAGRRADDVADAGLAVDIVLAAAVSAFAAAVMDLVAVFIACIADDIVLADDVALVAAAVILVAADVTLVAADDTVRAALAGVAELRLELRVDRVERDAVLRAGRDAVRRAAVLRVDRAVVLRVDRADVLRVDRDAGFRVVDEAVPAGLAAVLRRAVDLARLVALVDFGRLAVPDALRLTDLLRAVLAGLRRLAARVVV
jgi:hypothetical protein